MLPCAVAGAPGAAGAPALPGGAAAEEPALAAAQGQLAAALARAEAAEREAQRWQERGLEAQGNVVKTLRAYRPKSNFLTRVYD